jgi:hypothetical protein
MPRRKLGATGLVAMPVRPGCIDWNATPHLKILKSLAYVAYEHDPWARRNKENLWKRCAFLLPLAVKVITGEKDVRLGRVCEEVRAAQGQEITRDKLWDRARRASQGEMTPHEEDVLPAVKRFMGFEDEPA